MKRILTYILSLIFATNMVYGQNFNDRAFEELTAQQRDLTHRQDSLQTLLNSSRESLSNADIEQRNTLSSLIVSLEGELFDVRAKLGRVGSEIASYEEQYAQDILSQASENSVLKNIKIYQSDKLKIELSPEDIAVLKNAATVERQTIEAINKVSALYDSLCATKVAYDETRSQRVTDSLLIKAQTLSDNIYNIDLVAGDKWQQNYNYILGLYIVMLNSSPNADRTILEAIDQQSREVRRNESFIEQESITPHLSVFKIQRSLLLSYEEAIAKTLLLGKDCSVFSSKASVKDITSISAVTFPQRVLTLYSPVVENFDFTDIKVDDIEEVILPEQGVYYSIQVAILSQKAQGISIFRDTGPVQLQITPQGKYRYMIGGFERFQEAEAGVAELKKIGFRAPTVVAFLDGEYTSNDKAKEAESKVGESDKFKVILSTQDIADSDTLDTVVEMHGAGKNVAKMMANGNYIFTISEFEAKEEAEVFAQILRDRTKDATITVEIL